LAATQTLITRQIENKRPQARFDPVPLLVTASLTVVAILIHGFHPYAEDGGIYLPGILKLVHPELYPTWTGFVTAQTRFSLFAPSLAGLVRFTGMGVMPWLFTVYVLSIWGTLYSAWLIALRCFESAEARYGAVAILALCMTAPAAGTSLLLVDPYVTARSLSTPLGLLAIAGTLDIISDFKQSSRVKVRALVLTGGSLVIAAAMHPLMASYAACCVLLLVCASISNVLLRTLAFAGAALFALIVATLVQLLAPLQPPGYATVAHTRYYWFLSAWQWYEIVGLIAPQRGRRVAGEARLQVDAVAFAEQFVVLGVAAGGGEHVDPATGAAGELEVDQVPAAGERRPRQGCDRRAGDVAADVAGGVQGVDASADEEIVLRPPVAEHRDADVLQRAALARPGDRPV